MPGLNHNKVWPDNQSGACQMTRHLIEEHHYEEIAFIGGPKIRIHSEERLLGYRQALLDHKIGIRDEWIAAGEFEEASGCACAKGLMNLPHPPWAIFAGNERMAIGAISVPVILRSSCGCKVKCSDGKNPMIPEGAR